MKELSQKDIIEYLYNCYTKVDGLWFVKIEEEKGFERALALDAEVWKVMPKIQARFLKEKLMENIKVKKRSSNEEKFKKDQRNRVAVENSTELFLKALKVKLALDRFKFKIFKRQGLISVKITECPWHNILIRAGRENLSSRIGSTICTAEYSVFAGEFIPGATLELASRICSKNKSCLFNFVF